MNLMKIGLYGLAGYGAYCLYEYMTAKKEESTTTTTTATVPFTGTRWQQDTPVGTRWQDRGVFNNACGRGY